MIQLLNSFWFLDSAMPSLAVMLMIGLGLRYGYALFFGSINPEKPGKPKLFLYSFCLFAIYAVPALCLSALLSTHPVFPFLSLLLALQFPLLFFANYYFVRKLSGLSVQRSIFCAQYLYLFFNISILIYHALRLFCLHQYNGFTPIPTSTYHTVDILARLATIPFCVLGYYALKKMLGVLQVYTDFGRFHLASRSEAKPIAFFWGFVTSLATYIISTGLLFWMTNDPAHIAPIAITLLLLLSAGILLLFLWDLYGLMQSNQKLGQMYLKSLSDSIDEFSGIRHDLANLLQIYDGFIRLKDYDSLEEYHNQVFAHTRFAADRLLALRQLERNPVILGLVLSALEKADNCCVDFHFPMPTFLLNDVPLEFDTSRILSILLNNALEAAEQSEKRVVRFTIEREAQSIVFIIANTTDTNVDIPRIFQKGYSTKEQHQGHGLWEVSKIVSRSDVYSIHCECLEYVFTAFLRLKLN